MTQILVQGIHTGSNLAVIADQSSLDSAKLGALARGLVEAGTLDGADSTVLFPPYPVRVKTALSIASPATAGGDPIAVQGVFAWTKGTRIASPVYSVRTADGTDSNFQFLVKPFPQHDTLWNLSGNFSLQASASAKAGIDTLVVTLSDDSGRVAVARATFQVLARDTTTATPTDSAPPVIQAHTDTRDTAVPWSTTSYRLSWLIRDDSALGSVTLNGTDLAGKDGLFEKTVSLKVGRDSFVLVAKDKHGRESRSVVVLTRSDDTVRPSIRLVSPLRDTDVTNSVASMEIEISATDENGIDSVKINGVKLATSPYQIAVPLAIGGNVVKALAWDKAGNASETLSVTIRRANSPGDTTPPRIQRSAPTAPDTSVDYLVSKATLAYLVTDDSLASVSLDGKSLSSATNQYQTTVDLAVGTNTFVLLALDRHGNPARDTATIVRRKDTSKPVIHLVSPSRDTDVSFRTSSLSVSVAVSDTAGIDTVWIGGIRSTTPSSPYSATIPLQVGPNALKIEAVDKFGNRSTANLSIARAWAIDSVAPSVSRLAPTKDTTEVSAPTASFNLSWNVSDDSTLASVTLNGKPLTGVAGVYASTQPLVDGINTFALEAKDLRGNLQGDVVHIVRLTDPTKPLVAWQGGSKDTAVWAFVPSVLATWKVTDNALKLVTINGAATIRSGDLYSLAVDLATDVSWIRLMALDSSGNTVTDSVKVTRKYDKTPPTVVFQKTKVRLVANAVTVDTLVWTVSDDLRLKSVKVGDSTLSGAAGTYTLKVSLAVGTHRYVLVATDSAGNQTFDTAVVARTALPPTHSAPAGRYIGTVYDTLSSPGADSIVYSTDGTTWQKYVGTLAFTNTTTVYAKALPGDGLATATYTISQIKSVASGGIKYLGKAFTLFLLSNGDVWAVGSNGSGNFGFGSTGSEEPGTVIQTPLQGVTDVVVHYAGPDQRSFFRKTDGSWYASGVNSYGELGIGTWTSNPAPIALTDVVQVVSGFNESYFLRKDGTVWGSGNLLIDIGSTPKPTDGNPVTIPSLLKVAEIKDRAALDSNGTVWGWNFDISTPTELVTEVRTMARSENLLVLKTDGTIFGMGGNNYGQIGNGKSVSTDGNFFQTSGLASIVAISASGFHSLFLRNDGALFLSGMIELTLDGGGIPTGPITLTPTQIASGVTDIWSGYDVSYFKKSDGTLWYLGNGNIGPTGDGSTQATSVPRRVNF